MGAQRRPQRAPLRFSERLAEPWRLWIRNVPRLWTSPPGDWIDLATAGLRRDGPTADLTGATVPACADVTYLPPVAAGEAPARDELAARLSESGFPVLMQMGIAEARRAGEGTVGIVVDPLAEVLGGRLDELSSVPRGTVVIWPLVAGVTDGLEVADRVLQRLAAAGVEHVQGLALELTSEERRRFASLGSEEAFDALFHGPQPDERRFAAVAARYGFAPLMARPLPRGGARVVGNRQLAGHLMAIATLAERLGRSEPKVQAYYRAARLIDRESLDVTAVAREGNLGILNWLDGGPGDAVREALAGESSRLDQLAAEYVDVAL